MHVNRTVTEMEELKHRQTIRCPREHFFDLLSVLQEAVKVTLLWPIKLTHLDTDTC